MSSSILQPGLTPRALPAFEYAAPTTLSDALSLLSKYEAQGVKVLAGGFDLLYLMKKDVLISDPEVVVDIKGVSEANFLNFDASAGLSVGATTTISTLVNSPAVASSYPVLVQAASTGHALQIANVATVGGGLCQQVWCWFYRTGIQCRRRRDDVHATPSGGRHQVLPQRHGRERVLRSPSLRPRCSAQGA